MSHSTRSNDPHQGVPLEGGVARIALEEGRDNYRTEGHLVKPIYLANLANSQRPSGRPCNSDSQGQIGIAEIRVFWVVSRSTAVLVIATIR